MTVRYERWRKTRWHARKLTAEEVREIRREHRRGVSQGRLAKAYCVTQATIHQIVHRATWKDVAP